MDGTPTLRMNEFILSALHHGKVDLGSPTVRQELPAPKELAFELDATAKKNISEAEKHFDELVASQDLHVRRMTLILFSYPDQTYQVLHYDTLGKNGIKKYKVSPDAYAQLVKQLAFHKMHNRPGVCYESAQTRKYQLGRTEVIRSASNESKEWAEAMLNPSETVRLI